MNDQTKRDLRDRAVKSRLDEMRRGPSLAQAALYDRPSHLTPPLTVTSIRLAAELLVEVLEVWVIVRAGRRLRSLPGRDLDWIDAYWSLWLTGIVGRRLTNVGLSTLRARGQIEKMLVRAAEHAAVKPVEAQLRDLLKRGG